MRKISSILLGAALALTGTGTTYAQAAKTVPYSSPITTSASTFDDGWTIIDANGDGNDGISGQGKWGPSSRSGYNNPNPLGGYAARYYSFNNQDPADDYLVSPAIHLDGETEYKILYGIATESTSFPKDVYLYASTVNTAEGFKATTPLQYLEEYKDNYFKIQGVNFTPTESGDYYFAIYTDSPNKNYYLFASTFAVYVNSFTPETVSNLNVVRDASRATKATLTWTLPTQSVFGDPFTEEQTITAVNLYRDGALFKTLGGDVTTYTDTEEDGLEPGIHTYEVDVVVAGVSSAKASVTSKYIGPVQPEDVPFTWNISNQDDFEDWVNIAGDNAANKNNLWTFYSYGPYGRFSNSSGQKEEQYFIAPPFKVEKPGYYKVTVNAVIGNTSYNASNILKVVYGKESTVAGMNKVACEKIDFTSSSKTPYSYVVKIDEAGTYYFGVEAASENPSSTTFGVYSIGLEETEKTPAAVSNLKATPDPDFALKVVLTWDCPTTSAAGDALAANEYQTKVYKGTTVLATLDGGVNTYTDSNIAEAGVYTYSVETVAPQGASVGKQDITTRWVGPHQVDLPYTTNFAPSDNTATIWDIVDANNDGKTWHYYSNSYRCTQSDVDGTEPNTRQYNDYFLSPWFKMNPGYYEVKFRAIGGTTAAPMTHNVGVVEAGMFVPGRPELITQNKQFESNSQNSTSDSTNPLKTYIVKINQEGTYQIVFAAIGDQPVVTGSDLDYAGYGINNFSIAYYPVRPEIATELNVVAADNDELKATVTWKNPTATNVEGLALDNIVKANVLRDGVVAASLTENVAPGAEMTFVDTKETGLTGGPHTYSVEIYGEEGKSLTPAPTFKLAWVGGGYDIVGSGIVHNVAEFSDMWTFIDGDNNKVGTEGNIWSVAGTTAMKLDESTADSFDDWAVSPKFNIENGGQYEVKFKTYIGATYRNDAPFVFDVYVGSDDTPTVDTYKKVGTITSTNGNSTATSGQEYNSVYFKGADVAAALEEAVETGLVEVPTGFQHIALKATKKGGGFVQTITVKPFVLIEPPYTNNFETAADLDGFNMTPSGSTNADKIWHKGEGNYVELDASSNASGGSMSYLDTPAIAMEKDKYYVVSFKVWHSLATASSNFTFSSANNAEFSGSKADALKQLTAENVTEETAMEYSTLVIGDESNIKYLRIYSIAQNGDVVYLTDLNIVEYAPELPISLATPYLNSFNTPLDMYGYVVSPEGRWALSSGFLTNSSGDATITTPPFAMREGRDYKVSFDLWSGNVNNIVNLKYGSDLQGELTDALKVFINSAANPEGEPAEGEIRGQHTNQATAYRAETVITGNSTGTMYLVFDTKTPGRSNFCITNLRIEDISPIELPYENALTTPESIAGFTLTPETDGWFYSVNGHIVLNGPSGTGSAVATMVTPALQVEEGKEYMVKIDASSGNTNSTLKILTGSSLDNMTGGEAVNLTSTPQTIKVKVTGNADGVLYVGLEGSAFSRSSIQVENLYVGDYVYEAPAIPEDAYVVYADGVVASDLDQFWWWNATWNVEAESPTGEGKAFKFTATDGGAAASMGLAGANAEAIGRLHNGTLHFNWYAEGSGKYRVQLTGAGSNYFIDLNKETEAEYNTWNTVTVDIPEEFPTLATSWNEVTGAGDYVFAVLLDNGSEGDAIYFNQIYYTGVDEEWVAPEAPAPETVPVPEHDAENVISVYGSTYTPATTWNRGGWGQSTQISEVDIDDQKVEWFRNFNYEGWELTSDLNVSDYDYMHVDMWTDAEGKNFGITPITRAGDATEKSKIQSVVANEWNSYDLPLAEWAAIGMDLSQVFQIKFDQGDGYDCYVTNVYFWKSETPVEPVVKYIIRTANAGDFEMTLDEDTNILTAKEVEFTPQIFHIEKHENGVMVEKYGAASNENAAHEITSYKDYNGAVNSEIDWVRSAAVDNVCDFQYDLTNHVLTVAPAGTLGVDRIGAENGEVRYFDLNGFEVKNPYAGQILIKVKDGKTTKVLIK